MRTLLLTLGGTFFWIISPESLTILTNGAAMAPAMYILPVILFTILVLSGRIFLQGPTAEDASGVSTSSPVFRILSTVIGCGGIIGTTLFAGTGLLVTAGFTFNEVFLYYFPNFGFAFLLLSGIATLHLFFAKRVFLVQGILVALVLCCIAGLTIGGLLSGLQETIPAIDYRVGSVSAVLPLFLIFAGFEQIKPYGTAYGGTFAVFLVLIIVILTGWMMVSGLLVSPQRLAFSTVPYMTSASGIAGTAGRLIMGCAIICGSLAAVSGLFTVSRNFLGQLVPRVNRQSADKVFIVLLTLGIGGAMATGLAGEARLEVYLRGALTLWLFYGGFCVFQAGKCGSRSSITMCWGPRIIGMVLMLLSLASAVLIREREVLLIFFVCLLASSLLCIMVVRLMHGYSTSQRRIIKNKETLS